MGRPSNAQIDAEIEQAIEEARHELWAEMADKEHAALPVVRSKEVDRKSRLRAAARIALVRQVSDELNDSTSDININPEDVRAVILQARR